MPNFQSPIPNPQTPNPNPQTPAIFLDRDGVINELIYYEDHGIVDSPFTPEQMRVFPWVPEAIKRFKELGYKVIIASNQPGIAKGHFTWETFQRINQEMLLQIQRDGVKLDGEYYCFHHPEAKVEDLRKDCPCRKPNPGLLLKAAAELNIDLRSSWMIGDGLIDIKAGKEAGCRTIFIGKLKCDICQLMLENGVRPDFVAKDLLEAVQIVKSQDLNLKANWPGQIAREARQAQPT